MKHELTYDLNDKPYIRVDGGNGSVGFLYAHWPEDDGTVIVAPVSLLRQTEYAIHAAEAYLREQGYTVL